MYPQSSVNQRWFGENVFCLASGPSLNARDCEQLVGSNARVIVVNNAWELFPEADVLYAGDLVWWENNIQSIRSSAERWTCSRSAYQKFNVNFHIAHGGYNSGLRAIELAISFGVANVYLLGFDCSVENGIHFHGPHIGTKNPDELRCELWKAQFAEMARRYKNITNCSRKTALHCFPHASLEAVIESL